MAPAGEIIYKAFVPTLKMGLTVICGYIMSKNAAFASATRGIGMMTLNLCLPGLIFSSMVTSFTPQNAAAFGPLIMVAVMYECLGGLCGLVVRELFYVPKDFRWGILVMGVVSNWGNLPTAIVQTMAKEPPFDPSTDVDLGVAYISIFILMMNSTFFPLGLHKICGWDFMEEHIKEPLPFRVRWQRRLERLRGLGHHHLGSCKSSPDSRHEVGFAGGAVVIPMDSLNNEGGVAGNDEGYSGPPLAPSTSHMYSTAMAAESRHSLSRKSTRDLQVGSTSAAAADDKTIQLIPTRRSGDEPYAPSTDAPTVRPPKRSPWAAAWGIIKATPPPSWAVAVGLPCSLVQPLKALFVRTPNWSGTRVPYAPDGNPPLEFILETANFIGAIAVPVGLLLLGASFARLKVPTRWRDLPLVAILAMALAKMVIVPVFAVFVIQAFRDHTNLFPPDQKISTFVAILLSGTPAAVNQLVVTQLYNPAGTADTLASFLLVQYLLMFVLSTALAAIALYIVQ